MDELAQEIKQLQNILDTFIPPPPITGDEHEQLVETAAGLIDDLISSDTMLYANPSFDTLVQEETCNLIELHMDQIFDYDVRDLIEKAVSEARFIFHTHVCPRRSYPETFIRRKPNMVSMRAKLTYLENVPQPDQRTPEWYHFRHNFLTASSIWKAFGTQRLQDQLIYDKCKPLNVDKYKSFSVESPLHWGQKYEDVSIQWYEKEFSTKVSDYGCIPHPNVKFLAASPDGINTDPSSQRFGRMLEVKNIVNREITGIPKLEYWIQMQLQMEVCNLNECDFLETRFKEYESKADFMADGEFHLTASGKPKGVMMFFMKEGQPLYEYAPFGCTEVEFNTWEQSIMAKHSALTWMQNIYWHVDQISCILVLRNKSWFNAALPQLDKLWSTIEKEKVSGYEHRAPNRKPRVKTSPEIKPAKCYIDISALLQGTDCPGEQVAVVPKTPSPVQNQVITIQTQSLDQTSHEHPVIKEESK